MTEEGSMTVGKPKIFFKNNNNNNLNSQYM